MDGISAYSFGSLGWLSLQALPLIIWPGFISSLLRDETQHTSALEEYYARSLGLALLALGLTTVVLSGALPLAGYQAASAENPSASSTSTASPFADAALAISALHHAAGTFYCYGRYTWTGQTAFAFGGLGSAVFASFGLWCVMFAGDKGRVSKRTGFDKDTSGFPFRNTESYRAKKKGI